MKPLLILALLAALMKPLAAAENDPRCFEMRIYQAAPGKLEALNSRFRDHTCKLFEKHGIVNLGYWVPQENPDQKLIYLLAYPNRAAREASWKAFMADPDWQAASRASEKDGKLVTKVESRFMTATDYSPKMEPKASGSRVFELRTYTTTPGNLSALDSRFRDHTLGLFRKHGMESIAYWHLMPGEKGADTTLIYLLAHKSKDAGLDSFKNFRVDPDWVAAREASEKKAGGSLTVKDGVQSVYMNPTDYSQTR